MKSKVTAPDNPLLMRARLLGLWGVVDAWNEFGSEPWLPNLLDREEKERTRRSLERRSKRAKLARFKPLSDFDWAWPKAIDRQLVEELLTLDFISSAANVLIVGDHGTGKTMIAKNIANHAVQNGYSALFVTANMLLNDLADKGTGSALLRRIKTYARADLLVIDELGYLATSNKHADLLFHVVNERYQSKPILLTTNKSVEEWADVFPGASSLVGIVDRLVHHSHILSIDAESYRLKEAKENDKKRRSSRSIPTKKGVK